MKELLIKCIVPMEPTWIESSRGILAVTVNENDTLDRWTDSRDDEKRLIFCVYGLPSAFLAVTYVMISLYHHYSYKDIWLCECLNRWYLFHSLSLASNKCFWDLTSFPFVAIPQRYIRTKKLRAHDSIGVGFEPLIDMASFSTVATPFWWSALTARQW